jgi:hypothetical protein
VPQALRQLGCAVTLLSDDDLASGDLSRFDAIVVGIRAYNVRSVLTTAQARLLDYVRRGGTLVEQYNTTQDLTSAPLGPYPFEVSHERVSVEEAPVTLTPPDHPLLRSPNVITPADFDGWVQERGLYFAEKWDPRYETPLTTADPGQAPQAGGLLYARYGAGVYVYTSFAWFRQLPAGVPGAYRIVANLVAARGTRGAAGK